MIKLQEQANHFLAKLASSVTVEVANVHICAQQVDSTSQVKQLARCADPGCINQKPGKLGAAAVLWECTAI